MPASKNPIEAFHEKYKIDPITGCWNWTASVAGNGYPKLSVNRKTVTAGRWYYGETREKIPDFFETDHLCMNILCVNPEHLEPVTRAENNRRRLLAYKTGRTKWKTRGYGERPFGTCRRGHKMTPENTIDKKDGTFTCRTCKRVLQRNWAKAKRRKLALAA